MKRGWTLFFILFAFSATAEESTIVSGVITNKISGAPIAEATVFVKSLNLSATPDAQGAYVLSLPITSDQHKDVTINVSAPGFDPISVVITLVPGKVVHNFSLSPAIQEQINVGATAPNEEPDTPEIPDTITQDDTNATDLEGILAKTKNNGHQLQFRVGLENRYDDNLFQYSDLNQERFDPDLPKFAGLSSVNDMLIAVPMRIDYDPKKYKNTSFTGIIDPHVAARNSDRNHMVYYARVEQKMSKTFTFSSRYLHMPGYFLLRLADPPNQRSEYENAEYTFNSIQAGGRWTLSKRIGTSFSGEYGQKDYNPEFTHLDNVVKAIAGAAQVKVVSFLRVQSGITYERTLSHGRNDPITNYDTSYKLNTVYVAPVFKVSNWCTVTPKVTHDQRTFTSSLVRDRNHFGRKDSTWTDELDLKLEWGSSLEFHVGFEHIDRSSNRNGVDLEFSSFTENRTVGAVYWDF